jgi:hypothetical protein
MYLKANGNTLAIPPNKRTPFERTFDVGIQALRQSGAPIAGVPSNLEDFEFTVRQRQQLIREFMLSENTAVEMNRITNQIEDDWGAQQAQVSEDSAQFRLLAIINEESALDSLSKEIEDTERKKIEEKINTQISELKLSEYKDKTGRSAFSSVAQTMGVEEGRDQLLKDVLNRNRRKAKMVDFIEYDNQFQSDVLIKKCKGERMRRCDFVDNVYLNDKRFTGVLSEMNWVSAHEPFSTNPKKMNGHFVGISQEFIIVHNAMLWLHGDVNKSELVVKFPIVQRYEHFLLTWRKFYGDELLATKLDKFGKHPLGREPGILVICDEEEYWTYVVGVSKDGKGRPQFPKKTRFMGRMLDYHRRMLREYHKQNAVEHFKKIKKLLKLPCIIKARVPPDSRRERERVMMKRMEKQFIKDELLRTDDSIRQTKRQAELSNRIELEMFSTIKAKLNWTPKMTQPSTWVPTVGITVPGVEPERLRRIMATMDSPQVHHIIDTMNSSQVQNILNGGSTIMKGIHDANKLKQDVLSFLTLDQGISQYFTNYVGKIVNFLVFMLRKDIDNDIKFSFVAQIIPSQLGNVTSLISSIVSMYQYNTSDADNEPTRIVVEVGENDKGLMTGLWHVVKSLFGQADIGDLSGREIVVFRNLHTSITAVKDMSQIGKPIKDFIEWIMRKVYSIRSGTEIFPWERDEAYNRVDNWITYYTKFLVVETTRAVDFENYIKEYESTFKDLQKNMILSRNLKLKQMWTKVENESTDFYRKAKRFLNHPGARKQPVAIMLMGKTAVGKSLMTTILARNIAEMLGIHYTDASELIYPRNRLEEFWSGYSNQPLCVFDEFMAILDDKMLMNEGLDILRTVNEAPFKLPMAALDEKGKHFNSDAILCTTNVGANEARIVLPDNGGSCPPQVNLPAAITKNCVSSKAIMGRFHEMIYFVEKVCDITKDELLRNPKEACDRAWRFHPYLVVEQQTETDNREYPVTLVREKEKIDELSEERFLPALKMSDVLLLIQEAFKNRDDSLIEVIKTAKGVGSIYKKVQETGLVLESGTGQIMDFYDSPPHSFTSSDPLDSLEEEKDEVSLWVNEEVEIDNIKFTIPMQGHNLKLMTREHLNWLYTTFASFEFYPLMAGSVYEVMNRLRVCRYRNHPMIRNLLILLELGERTGGKWLIDMYLQALEDSGDHVDIYDFVSYLELEGKISRGEGGRTQRYYVLFKARLKAIYHKVAAYAYDKIIWAWKKFEEFRVSEKLRRAKEGITTALNDFEMFIVVHPLAMMTLIPVATILITVTTAAIVNMISNFLARRRTVKNKKKIQPQGMIGGYPPAASDARKRIRRPAQHGKPNIKRVVLQEGETAISEQEPDRGNLIRIEIKGEGYSQQLWGIFVCNRIMMLPAHMFSRLFINSDQMTVDPEKINDIVTITTAEGQIQCRVRDIIFDLFADPVRDIAFLDLASLTRMETQYARMLPERKNIVKHFLKTSDIDNSFPLKEGMYMLRYRIEHGKVSTKTQIHPVTPTIICNYDGENVDRNILEYPDTFGAPSYPPVLLVGSLDLGYSGPGDCGLPYMLPRVPRGIVGFHAARHSDTGERLVRIVTQEEIKEFLLEMGVVSPSELVTDRTNIKQEETKEVLDSCGSRVIQEGYTHYLPIPDETGLRKMILHPDLNPDSLRYFGPSTMDPAPLKRMYVDGELISPMHKALKEMKPLVNTITKEEVKKAARNLHQQWRPIGSGRPYILSLREAICGINGVEGYNSLEKDTACGFIYKTKYANFGDKNQRGKNRFIRFTKDNDYEFIRDKDGVSPVELEYVQALYLMVQGKPCFPLFEDIGKDEKLGKEKVAIGRVRIFSVGPIHWLIIVKQIFNCLLATMQKRRKTAEAKIGMKAHSDDWNALYATLRKFENLMDGDFKNWDKTQVEIVLRETMEEFRNWYHRYRKMDFYKSLIRFLRSTRDLFEKYQLNTSVLNFPPLEIFDKILTSIEEDTVLSEHVVMGLLYLAIAIISSGHYLTAALGSAANQIYQRVAFYRHAPNEIFEACVGLGVLGDDNIQSISNRVIDVHNGITLERTFASFGMTYTNGSKSGEVRKVSSFLEAEFNKRRFVVDGPRLRVPIRKRTLVEMLYWRDKSMDDMPALLETLKSWDQDIKEYSRVEHDDMVRSLRLALESVRDKGVNVERCMKLIKPYDYWLTYQSEMILCSEKNEEDHLVQQELPHLISLNQRSEPLPIELEILNKQYTSLNENVTFNDSNVLVSSETIISDSIRNSSGRLEHKDLDMERIYDIDTFAWTSAGAVGLCVGCYRFPEALLGVTALWDRMQHKYQFRAGVEVSLRINSSIFHHGTLMISWLPFYDPTNITNSRVNSTDEYTAKMGSLDAMSANPTILLSANTAETIKFTIPYRAPYPWMVPTFIQSGATSASGIGSVVIRILDPLVCSGQASATADVVVSARFVNFEWTTTLNQVRAAYAPTINRNASVVTESLEIETQKKSSSGLLSGIAEATERVIGKFSQIPIVGSYVGGAKKILRFTSGGLKALGLNKPTDVRGPEPAFVKLGSDLNFTKGLDSVTKLSMDPAYTCSNDQSVIGFENDETSLRYLATRPCLLSTFSFSGATAPGTLKQLSVCPQLARWRSVAVGGSSWYVCNPSHVAFLSRLFKYWRGSMKYLVHVCTASTTSTRLRVSWSPVTFATTTNTGELYSEVFDITGTQTFCFSVPYSHEQAWKMCGAILDQASLTDYNYANGTLNFHLMNPPVSATTESGVRVTVFATMGEDMQFQGSSNPWSDALLRTSVPNYALTVAKPKISLTSDYVLEVRMSNVGSIMLYGCDPFPSLGVGFQSQDQGVCMRGEFNDLKELTHRYALAYSPAIVASSIWNDNTPAYAAEALSLTAGSTSLAGIVPMLYMFVKGPIRYRVHTTTDGNYYVAEASQRKNQVVTGIGLYGWEACAALDGKHIGETGVEIPWYSRWTHGLPKVASSGTQTDGNYVPARRLNISGTANTTMIVWQAYGDDFDMGFLCAPPGVWGNPSLISSYTSGTWPA